MTKIRLLTYGAALALSLGATVANAVVTECPGAPNAGLRVFTVDTTPASECWDYGLGNPKAKDAVETSTPTKGDSVFEVPVGYMLLDKSDSADGPYEGLLTGTSTGFPNDPLTKGLSGTFLITMPSTYQYLLVFKTGGGILDPDWASFLLGQGVLSGSWAISGNQALSHVELWGKNVVPLPAAAWLLGSGLLGLFAVGRRRKGAQVAAS